MTRAIMFMGTGSDVGKSLIVAGLARAFTNRGLRVAPFKPQNMSNNAAVTADGGEIGRAQALQARAARREPLTAMNPVLLKPEHEKGAQLIVRGRRVGSLPARDYFRKRRELMPDVVGAFRELAQDADLILVEGAGSASEVNLRLNDIANFGFARELELPVILIGDIQRGGVIASLVGTLAVIEQDDAALVRATLVNKFQGDPALFLDGRDFIARHTGRPCLGPIPFFRDASRLPAEDSLALEKRRSAGEGAFTIAVPKLPRIANFDDLDPLVSEPGVSVRFVHPGEAIPSSDLIILPGSKATIADLDALRREGWDIDLRAHLRQNRPILGICGGYQMLGQTLADPDGLEGPPGTVPGLGLLAVDTTLEPAKQLRLETACHEATGQSISGYHMHLGRTAGPDTARPFARVSNAPEGAVSPDGFVMGTYLHALFASDGFRRAFLESFGAAGLQARNHEAEVETVLDRFGEHLAVHLDLDQLLAWAVKL
jgi:adenosylcobyric acid synthase